MDWAAVAVEYGERKMREMKMKGRARMILSPARPHIPFHHLFFPRRVGAAFGGRGASKEAKSRKSQ
jgi:hypothetical protein